MSQSKRRNWRWLHPRVMLRELLSLDDTPHAIALGAAVGMWVGLTPTVGIQIPLVVFFGLVFRRLMYFNVTAGLIVVFISNPLTTPPIYYGSYRLGCWLLGRKGNVDFGAILSYESLSGWWDAVCRLFVEAGWPLCFGSLVLATSFAIPTYFAMFWLAKRFRNPTSAPGHEILTSRRKDESNVAETNDSTALRVATVEEDEDTTDDDAPSSYSEAV